MFSKFIIASFSFLLIATNVAWGQGLPGAFSAGLTCDKVKDIQKGYLLVHILYNEANPMLEKRTIERYIKFLDSSKMLFTKGDVDKMNKDLTGIFADLEKRNCKKLMDVQALFNKRMEDRAEFTKKTLTKDFKLDKKTKLVLNAEKREYAKDDAELKELQKKYIHFQVSNYILADEKLPDAMDKIKRNYDRVIKKFKETKDEDIFNNYLNAFGHALDAHTSYFSADSLEDFEISMRLSLQGIGATLTSEDGYTVVESLVKGGAAQKSGLVEEKDKIIAVGQEKGEMEDVVDQDLRDVVKRIRGDAGTKVRLKLLRRVKGGKATSMIVTLNRAEVKLEDDAASISYVERKNNGVSRKIGVINLPSFYADSRQGGRSCAKDVANLIDDAKKNKADGLVLDVSMNGGGSLSDAVDLAGLFFATGNVVKQSSRSPQMKASSLKDENPTVNWAGPLVILTSPNSASASEIVSGALKDYGRAVIVGSNSTFGKGTVQQVLPLAPGLGALKVTIGMFFTPGGFSTQHRGVASHIVIPSEWELDDEEQGEKSLDYSLPPNKVDSFISQQAYVTDGPGKWDKIDANLIETLKKRSTERVSTSKEFAEIKKKVEKHKNESKEIVLEDSFNESKTRKDEFDKKKKFTDSQKKEDYLKRADVNEAVNVVVDMTDLKNKVPLKVIAQSGAPGIPEERKVQSATKKNQLPPKEVETPGSNSGDNAHQGAIKYGAPKGE